MGGWMGGGERVWREENPSKKNKSNNYIEQTLSVFVFLELQTGKTLVYVSSWFCDPRNTHELRCFCF